LHDAEHLALRPDDTYLRNTDTLIDARTGEDTLSRIEVGLIDGRNLR
jgi:hypothetical protein